MELGRIFLGAARAPLGRSSERFSRNLIGDGVRALSKDNLLGAVDAGVRALAGELGLSPDEASASLPMGEIQGLAGALGEKNAAAIAAIRRNDLTITNFALPAPSASPVDHLVGVAEHFARDKHINRSLLALSGDVRAWEDLLAHAAATLDADGRLVARWRWRRMRKYVLAGAAAVVVLVVVVVGVVTQMERAAAEKARLAAAAAERDRLVRLGQRIDAALAVSDPCQPIDLSDEERSLATDAQQKVLVGRNERCAQIKKRAAHDKGCAALADAVAKGETPPTGETTGPVLAHLLARALEPSDLRAGDAELGSCADTSSASPLWAAIAAEASGRAFLWGKADGVSPKLAEKLSLVPKAKQSVGFRAEIVAKRALVSGKTDDWSGAKELCALKERLQMPPGTSCKALGKKSG